MTDFDDLDLAAEGTTTPPAFTEEPLHPERVRLSTSGITLELDLHQMLTAIDPQGSWMGYDPDADEDRFEPASLADHLIKKTSELLVKAMRQEVRKSIEDAVHTAVMAEVKTIVREALENGELQATNEYGGKVGEPRPLNEIIVTTARDALTKPVGDRYDNRRGQTVVQKLVTDAVGAAFAKELQAEVDQARAATKKAVRDQAAKVIEETIQRATRGL